jgi:hypothetical protein
MTAARPLTCALAMLLPFAAHAQKLGWSTTVEASANVLFGNAQDRLFASRVQLGRADSTLEVRSDARFTYAESTVDAGQRVVRGRTALASLATDYRPFARYSPFWFGSVEASLQQRIERRYSTGAGAKLTFYRQKQNEASVSLAVLAERTQQRDDAPAAADPSRARWLNRWSLRARTRHQLSRTARFTHTTFYQPVLDEIARYTVSSTTTLAGSLTSKLSLTATFHDTYDSEARARGARSNNDGQLLFGLSATF